MLKPLLVAVDTNFLLDLAIEKPLPQQALAYIRKKKPETIFLVPPTVLDELAHQMVIGNRREMDAAALALASLRIVWGMRPCELIPVGHGIVACIADKIRERGYIPDAERNDSFILAESALLDCKLLITSDHHLLNAPHVALHSLLTVGHDVGCPLVVSPYQLSQFL